MTKKLLLMSTFLFSAASFAVPISKIEVTNNTNVPKEFIISNIQMREGAEYDAKKSNEDINRLKAMKYFSDVNLKTEEKENGIVVHIDVKEAKNAYDMLKEDGLVNLVNTHLDAAADAIISNIEIIGNSSISSGKILDIANSKSGDSINERKVADIQARLVASGYFRNVKVGFKGTKLKIEVLENPFLKDIVVEGASLYSNEQLRSLVQTKPGEIVNNNTIREDAERIRSLYQKDGYVLAGVSSATIDENGIMHLHITESVVRSIEAKKMITMQKGARRKPNDDVLKTQDYVIDREVTIEKGKMFNIKDFDQTANNLMRLGIFRNIKYEAIPIEGDPNGVKIVLLIDEDRTASIQGGISYGTESGFMGNASIKDINWSGKNQEVEFSVEKSTKSNAAFSISFFDPWIKDTNRVSWGWGAYRTTTGNASDVFNITKVLGARANIGKGISRNMSINIGTKFEYLQESPSSDVKVDANDSSKGKLLVKKNPDVYEDLVGLNDKYYLATINPYIVYDTRNNIYNATSGVYGKLQLEGGYANGYDSGLFGSLTTDLRYYHKGFGEKNSFAFRLQSGIMTKTTKESQKFWVGGGNSLRGYDSGDFRGNKKLVFTAENRTQINDIIGFVLFVDAGRAWDYSTPASATGRDYPRYLRNDTKKYGNIALGAGVGLRLNTPIGPLRFDLGWPINMSDQMKIEKREGKESRFGDMKFYFNMGHSF